MSVLLAMFSAVAQGMLWAMLALGVYITFRLLDFADLTCEGSFAMGACISAVMTVTYHMNPFVSLIFGFLGGAIAGTVTGLLNTKLKIPPILAGILSMISLYSINLRIMSDKANLPINVREEGVESMVTFIQKLTPRIHTDHESDHDGDRSLYRPCFLCSLRCGSLLVFWNRAWKRHPCYRKQ